MAAGATAAVAAPSDEPLILRTDQDGIATLTLNRPAQYNALSTAVMSTLLALLRDLAEDDTVRVVVLAGTGKAFSAGHDLKEIRADQAAAANSDTAVRAIFDLCSQLMLGIARCPKPVIARVHGIATAAGCQLVAAADLAVAARSARFAVSGVNLGLFCATPMVALTRNMPRKHAFEMLVTGDFIDAETALAYGLLNRVVDDSELEAATTALARAISAKSPVAVALGKQLFHRQLETTLSQAYDLATETIVRNMDAEDAQCGIDAFLAKRPLPAWSGR